MDESPSVEVTVYLNVFSDSFYCDTNILIEDSEINLVFEEPNESLLDQTEMVLTSCDYKSCEYFN